MSTSACHVVFLDIAIYDTGISKIQQGEINHSKIRQWHLKEPPIKGPQRSLYPYPSEHVLLNLSADFFVQCPLDDHWELAGQWAGHWPSIGTPSRHFLTKISLPFSDFRPPVPEDMVNWVVFSGAYYCRVHSTNSSSFTLYYYVCYCRPIASTVNEE